MWVQSVGVEDSRPSTLYPPSTLNPRRACSSLGLLWPGLFHRQAGEAVTAGIPVDPQTRFTVGPGLRVWGLGFRV